MKKIFFITVLSVLIFAFVTFIALEFINKSSAPYEEITQENLTKVNTVEPEIKVTTQNLEIEETLATKINEPLAFIYPVSGEIGLTHSLENLVYSKTLKEWITHNGVDIQAKRGTPVVASEEGIIENITETAGTGIEITISHKDDYKTVYANLSTKEMVKVGQKVEKGQTISGVGNTASFEYYEPEHLHFEMYKNNKPIDPLSVLVGD